MGGWWVVNCSWKKENEIPGSTYLYPWASFLSWRPRLSLDLHFWSQRRPTCSNVLKTLMQRSGRSDEWIWKKVPLSSIVNLCWRGLDVLAWWLKRVNVTRGGWRRRYWIMVDWFRHLAPVSIVSVCFFFYDSVEFVPGNVEKTKNGQHIYWCLPEKNYSTSTAASCKPYYGYVQRLYA